MGAFAVDILRPGADVPERAVLEDGRYTIGCSERCQIVLSYPEISDRHALLTLRNGEAAIDDLGSSGGTFINNVRITAKSLITPADLLSIGSVLMRIIPVEELDGGAENDSASAETQQPDAETPEETASAPIQPEAGTAAEAPDHPSSREMAVRRQVKEQIHKELFNRLDLKRMTAGNVDQEGLRRQALDKIHEIVEEVERNGKLPEGIDPGPLEKEIFDEAMRLGPLEDLLDDPTITEIMVNGPDKIYIERAGRLELTDRQFVDDASVMAVIERIVSPIGRRIDESSPYVDARLADGSRVNAIIPPLALSGPTITIRKFAKRKLTPEDFIKFGTWTHNCAEFMRACVLLRKNIVVAGGTGSGKTTLLNLLSGYIPASERIVTVEDAAELRLVQPHVVRLEARPPNIEGRGAVTIRDLVKNCLRMRPDRIIVGECRGGEALDMLQAMNTGHDGSLTTVHANSPRDVIARLETMVLMSGMDLPSRAIREQIASAVDVIIHESRMSDGTRKVVAVSEIVGLEGQQIVMQDIFAFNQTGIDSKGRVTGTFKPTGNVPAFYQQLVSRGLKVDPAMFDPESSKIVSVERVES